MTVPAGAQAQHREIGERIVGDDVGVEDPPVGERATDPRAVAGDMEVGQHVPLVGDQDAAAGAGKAHRPAFGEIA